MRARVDHLRLRGLLLQAVELGDPELRDVAQDAIRRLDRDYGNPTRESLGLFVEYLRHQVDACVTWGETSEEEGWRNLHDNVLGPIAKRLGRKGIKKSPAPPPPTEPTTGLWAIKED